MWCESVRVRVCVVSVYRRVSNNNVNYLRRLVLLDVEEGAVGEVEVAAAQGAREGQVELTHLQQELHLFACVCACVCVYVSVCVFGYVHAAWYTETQRTCNAGCGSYCRSIVASPRRRTRSAVRAMAAYEMGGGIAAATVIGRDVDVAVAAAPAGEEEEEAAKADSNLPRISSRSCVCVCV